MIVKRRSRREVCLQQRISRIKSTPLSAREDDLGQAPVEAIRPAQYLHQDLDTRPVAATCSVFARGVIRCIVVELKGQAYHRVVAMYTKRHVDNRLITDT
jgi:hypothetical protein